MRRHKKRKLVVKNKIHHKFLILATLILSLTIISGISILNNHKALDYPFVSEYQEKYSHLQKLTSFKALPLPEITEHGQRDKKTIALTFDADMTYGMLDELNKGIIKSWYNRPLVDYLVKNNIKASIPNCPKPTFSNRKPFLFSSGICTKLFWTTIHTG